MTTNSGDDDEREVQQLLQTRINDLVSTREYPKTACPSEVARKLSSQELEQMGCRDWREAMQPVRQAAWAMHTAGRIEITQKGERIAEADLDDVKGPIRIRAKK